MDFLIFTQPNASVTILTPNHYNMINATHGNWAHSGHTQRALRDHSEIGVDTKSFFSISILFNNFPGIFDNDIDKFQNPRYFPDKSEKSLINPKKLPINLQMSKC